MFRIGKHPPHFCICAQVIALMVPAIGIANGVGCEDAKLHKKIVKKSLRDTAGIQCLAEMGFLREDYTKKLEEGVSLNYDTPSQRVFQLLFYT